MSKESDKTLGSLLKNNSKKCADGSLEIPTKVFLDAACFEGCSWQRNANFNGKGKWEHNLIYNGILYRAYSRRALSVGDF
jgi:hypothetical protein